jgi:Na+/H+-dicarboxylate symporter
MIYKDSSGKIYFVSTGIGSLNLKTSGRMGAAAIFYYLTTTVIAVIIGLVLVVLIQPGKGGIDGIFVNQTETDDNQRSSNPSFYALLDSMRNIFTSNIVEAFMKQEQIASPVNFNQSIDSQIDKTDGTNILGLLFISVTVGIMLIKIGDSSEGQLLLEIFRGINSIIIIAVGWLIW